MKQKRTLEIGINIFFIAVAVGVFLCSESYSLVDGTILGARTFPLIVAFILSVLAVVNIITASAGRKEAKDADAAGTENEEASSANFMQRHRVAMAIALVALYFLMLVYLGFIPATAVFLPAMLFLLEYQRTWNILLFTVVGVALLYVVFKVLLGVPLPHGKIF